MRTAPPRKFLDANCCLSKTDLKEAGSIIGFDRGGPPRNVWVDAGADLGGPLIGTGTWKVVRGTGQYAGIVGGGRSAHAGSMAGLTLVRTPRGLPHASVVRRLGSRREAQLLLV
jgi:hypothetical protein